MTKRVYHLVKGLNRGGAEVLLLELFRAHPTRTMRFGHLLHGADGVAVELRSQGAVVDDFGANDSPSILAAASRVARVVERHRTDVLHCHLPLAGVVGRAVGRLTGVPVVYSEHNRFDSYHPLTQLAARATWRLQRRVVAVSADVRTSIPDQSVPIDVVRNGVAVDRYVVEEKGRDALRRSLGISAHTCVIGTVAVFRPAKRLDRWLDVAAHIRRSGRDVRFLLVGYGPLDSEVRRWVRERELEDAVVLAGAQPDVRPYLGAMDVFLSSSDWEGLPVALLEAMAAARPVVATAVGGVAEAIDDAVGALVAPEADALRDAVQRFVDDPQRRKSAGEAGYARVAARFGVARMSEELNGVYERAM
jgi:glycosyltransferase involved in cell wall biosynthesis